MKTLHEKDYKMLHRKDYTIEIEHSKSSTPKNETLKKSIADFLKVTEEHLAIRHIYTEYGTTRSVVEVHVYNKPEELQSIEFKKKKPRKKKEKKSGGAKKK